MNRLYPVAVRPALPTLAEEAQWLDAHTRQALEARYRRLLELAIRAEQAQRLIGALHLAALQTVNETLWASERITTLSQSAGVSPEKADLEQALRAQYLETADQLVAIANKEVIRWLLEEE